MKVVLLIKTYKMSHYTTFYDNVEIFIWERGGHFEKGAINPKPPRGVAGSFGICLYTPSGTTMPNFSF